MCAIYSFDSLRHDRPHTTLGVGFPLSCQVDLLASVTLCMEFCVGVGFPASGPMSFRMVSSSGLDLEFEDGIATIVFYNARRRFVSYFFPRPICCIDIEYCVGFLTIGVSTLGVTAHITAVFVRLPV